MTTGPIGPKVAVMPAPGKPFEVFAAEDHLCRQYAEQSIGLPPDAAASKNFAGSAVAEAAIGTAAGALLGGREGAPVGAGVGAYCWFGNWLKSSGICITRCSVEL